MHDAIPPSLHALRRHFRDAGHDIRCVGGWVRDQLLGRQPKDLDLCTDADPRKMMAIFAVAKVQYRSTGLKHGTLTVILSPGETYEITTLRVDTQTDGRHAEVEWTTDWIADLARRDLTINAMSVTLDGDLVDPFNGAQDLKDRRIRFVGDPAERMREDYLRILRWIRFHFRIAPDQPLDPDTCEAAQLCASHLKDISAERVWSEVSRIVTGPRGYQALSDMMRLGIAYPCKMEHGSWREVRRVHSVITHPVSLMTAFVLDPVRMRKLADRWKWSTEERARAVFLSENLGEYDIDLRRLVAHEGHPVSYVRDLALLQDRRQEAEAIVEWEIPTFPVRGQDLIDAGFHPGRAVGDHLAMLKSLWAETGYALDRDALLDRVRPVLEPAE